MCASHGSTTIAIHLPRRGDRIPLHIPFTGGFFYARHNSLVTPKARISLTLVITVLFGLAYVNFKWDIQINSTLAAHPSLGWCLVVVGAVVWTWLIRGDLRKFRAMRRAKRMRAGKCPECGYDIHATTERCPECGTILKNPTAS